MDFDDTPEEAAYRQQARAWLESVARRRSGASARPAEDDWTDVLPAIRLWQRTKYDAGYGAISWPASFGGQGGTEMQEIIFQQEERHFDVPPAGGVATLARLALSAVRTFGSDAQRAAFMRAGLRADHVWCQLFSEPGAGSDLAGLRTAARADGLGWIIDGAKVWTTGGHTADFGLLVARSNPGAPKHKGLTCFILDMKTPGVSVRPLKQMTGASNFNQVFFDGVRIPDDRRLGPVDQGWQVAMSALSAERFSIASGRWPADAVLELLEAARQIDGGTALGDPAVRAQIADVYVRALGAGNTVYRFMTALSRGEDPGPAASGLKLVNALMHQEIASAAIDLMDQAGVISSPGHAIAAGGFHNAWLASPSARIAGGTDEIQRSLIAERVLGLPGDIRVDKDMPFRAPSPGGDPSIRE